MSFFKEDAPDVIDLVDMQRRGILKKSAEQNEDEFVDFSKQSSSQTTQSSQPSSFDFLNSLASVSSPAVSEQTTKLDDAQITNLKIKLEDLEYKLERFTERIAALEQKLNKE